MAKRIVCCPGTGGEKLEYLYIDTSKLLVEKISDEVAVLVNDAKERCCFDELSQYALGDAVLPEKAENLFSFDFYKINSFELFKNLDELRLKTGSEKILYSCLLNYYRREYDGTQQYAYFSDPGISNTHIEPGGAVEHELTLENREFIKVNKDDISELETLDKGKSAAEREAEAALAQAEAERLASLAEAEAKDLKKKKQKDSRKTWQRIEEERYREFRNRDDVQCEKYRRMREYEEELRRNNDFLSSQYSDGNYNSLPGYVSTDYFASNYEAVNKETLGIAVYNSDLYCLASRMDEFGVPYTVMGETLSDGKQISHVLYSSDYADVASTAKDFFELERNLRLDNVINDDTYFNAYQLSALEYAYNNNVDISYVSNGQYNGNQMYRIIDAGLNGYDMSVLSNPAYTPPHMDALTHYMSHGWDTTPLSDTKLTPSVIADSLMQEETRNGISRENSFFEKHDYDSFLSYGSSGYMSSFSNVYDNVQKENYYKQVLKTAKDVDSKENFITFKENLHNSYEQRQLEMNYLQNGGGSGQHPKKDTVGESSKNPSDKIPYSPTSSYTPTGYNKSDSSFSAYNLPNRAPAIAVNGSSVGGRGVPTGAPASNKMPGNRNALDDLKIRSNFAKRTGYIVQNYGSRIASASSNLVRNVSSKAVQADESGTMSGYHTFTRATSNIAMTAGLVMDLPRQFSRVGQKMQYGSASVAKACKGSKHTPLTSKEITKDLKSLQKQQLKQIKKVYGVEAAKMNIREINSNIKGFNKTKSNLTSQNASLRKEIQTLYNKKRTVGLSATEKLSLKDKLSAYSNNSAKISKKTRDVKKLEKLKNTLRANNKAANKLGSAVEKLGKKEVRWKRLPGVLTNSLVMQINKAGNDHTMGGLASASNLAMSYLRSPLRSVVRGIGNNIIVKPLKKATRKLVRKTTVYKKYRLRRIKKVQRKLLKVKKRQNQLRTVKKKLRKKAENIIGTKATAGLFKMGSGAKKGFSFINKIIGAPFKFLSSVFSYIKGALLKIGIWLGIGLIFIALLASIANALMSVGSSVMLIGDDDEKIDLSYYVNLVNENQKVLQNKINEIASGTGVSGEKYDNVFYDYVGNSGNNTAQILSMAYIRFDGQLEKHPTEVEEYIKRLYLDSNYVDSAVSDAYFCDNGCVTRNYFCYDAYDQYATETRKSLKAASNGKGCVPSKTYSCNEKVVIGKHNNGNAMDAPCSCENYKKETTMVETGGYVYYCNGYISGYETIRGQKVAIWAFHSPASVPMDTPCPCSDCKKEKEKVAATKYYCQGYYGKTYNKFGCAIHNNGAKMKSPCACDTCIEKEEKTMVKKYYCISDLAHNQGKAMNSPCSCINCKEDTETIKVKVYYCVGYCPGNHLDYTCKGHQEKVCYGTHQDITITITSLDFDDIFYADSSVAVSGAATRGDAYDNKFVVTGYCSCKECCGEYSPEVTGKPSTTASGTAPKANHTIATDWSVIPKGTRVWIDGKGYVAEDTGSAIKGNKIDIYFSSHSQASQWGKRTKTVYKTVFVSAENGANLEADEYGFKGWTEENIELVKNIYNVLNSDEAPEIYSGLNGIKNLVYGVHNSSEYDFSDIVFDNTSGLTSKQQKIVAVVKKNSLATVSGRCQAWVADVYQAALGGSRTSKCCANHAGEAWGVSNNWSDIQVGATVYGYSRSKYGHVGIYIGDGKVAHNIGYLKIQSLESWVNTYNGQCWGWNGGNNLTGNSKYKCKPSGTFMKGKD